MLYDNIDYSLLIEEYNYRYEDNGSRQKQLSHVKRVVVKVGTRLLMDLPGQTPAERVGQLIAAIQRIRQRGIEVILVTSGAVGAGLLTLDVAKRPRKMAALQGLAAVGQCHLMKLYEDACAEQGFHCGQLLLTAADLHDRERHVKVEQCLEELLRYGVLPVINENDSVCVDEIKVGDNDTLAALVGIMCRADLTIFLTTVNGLLEPDPKTGKLGRRISVVPKVNSRVVRLAGKTDGNRFSVGGMITKLRSAAKTACCGDPLWIADGSDFTILDKIFAGEDVGTLFLPERASRLHAMQRFIGFFAEPQGTLVIDMGADDALIRGRSLLPSGVLGFRGEFHAGDVVSIVNAEWEELGRGIVSYGSRDLSLICGLATEDLTEALGHDYPAADVVHRNAMVLFL